MNLPILSLKAILTCIFELQRLPGLSRNLIAWWAIEASYQTSEDWILSHHSPIGKHIVSRATRCTPPPSLCDLHKKFLKSCSSFKRDVLNKMVLNNKYTRTSLRIDQIKVILIGLGCIFSPKNYLSWHELLDGTSYCSQSIATSLLRSTCIALKEIFVPSNGWCHERKWIIHSHERYGPNLILIIIEKALAYQPFSHS